MRDQQPGKAALSPRAGRWRLAAICLAVAGLGAALAAGDLPYAYLHVPDYVRLAGVGVAAVASCAIAVAAIQPRISTFGGRWIVPASCLIVLAAQWASTAWWPNSADEYGYTFLANTLLHGRFYNPPPPAKDVFDVAWIFVRDGKWFSQYAPGFSMLLAPFLAVGAGFLLNPLLTACLAWLMLATLHALHVHRTAAASLTCLLVLSPFVVFNGAALFPHMLCAVALLGIVYAQAQDEAAPAPANRLAIGFLFSVLLLTRYEVFAIAAALYVADRFWAHRLRFARLAVPMALGGAPLMMFFLLYNAIITKRPLRTPYAWSSTGAGYGFHAVGDRGLNTPLVALERSLQWGTELIAYTSLLLVMLVAIALLVKLRARRLRYYDLIFPATLAFFFFFANTGGHRFGPRYWFFAWPTALLTVSTALVEAQSWLRAGRMRLHLPTLAILHAAAYAGFACVFAPSFSHYVAIRRQVYAQSPPHLPAIVLIPTRYVILTPFQTRPTKLGSADFPRNGVTLSAPILYGRADDGMGQTGHYVALACAVKGRSVYMWRSPGQFDYVDCGIHGK